MSKKYLLFIDSLGSGGAQNQVVQIAKGLKSKKEEVLVVYYHELLFYAPILDKSKVRHILINKNKIGYVKLIKSLKRLMNKEQITHVISFLEGPNFYMSIVKFLMPLSDFILVVSERSRTPKLSKFSKRFVIKQLIYFISSKIMTNSYHEKDNLLDQFMINKKKIFVIYNIVDLDKFKPRDVKKKQNTILCIGSVSSMKNGLLVVKALDDYNKTQSFSLKVDWYGEHALHIKERRAYSEQMYDLIKKCNLNDFWNWYKPIPEIYKEYSKYKCLILASTTEGLPNVVCEALSSGIPVIISKGLDHSKLVDKDRGYLFNPLNKGDLKNKLVNFYQLTDLEQNVLGINARKYAIENFSSEKNINKLIHIC